MSHSDSINIQSQHAHQKPKHEFYCFAVTQQHISLLFMEQYYLVKQNFKTQFNPSLLINTKLSCLFTSGEQSFLMLLLLVSDNGRFSWLGDLPPPSTPCGKPEKESEKYEPAHEYKLVYMRMHKYK